MSDRSAVERQAAPWEFWTFAAIGSFFVLLGVIYWFTSYEAAGTTMLLLCSGLGALGMWVTRPNRLGEVAGGEASGQTVDTPSEPHEAVESSLWPLIVGLGLMLVANGFVLGLWLLVPGGALVLRGLVGMLNEQPSATASPD